MVRERNGRGSRGKIEVVEAARGDELMASVRSRRMNAAERLIFQVGQSLMPVRRGIFDADYHACYLLMLWLK